MSHIKERQQELQPGRTEYAITRLRSLGYPVIEINATTLQFTFRVGNDNRMIEFFVTGKQYDVYHVAFKGFTKG